MWYFKEIEKTADADPVPNAEIFEIDLSQDDDSLGPIEKNDTTNTAASMQMPATDTKKKNSISIGASNAGPIAPKPKSARPSPSKPLLTLFNKRQRTRSIGIRYKVSEIVVHELAMTTLT